MCLHLKKEEQFKKIWKKALRKTILLPLRKGRANVEEPKSNSNHYKKMMNKLEWNVGCFDNIICFIRKQFLLLEDTAQKNKHILKRLSAYLYQKGRFIIIMSVFENEIKYFDETPYFFQHRSHSNIK